MRVYDIECTERKRAFNDIIKTALENIKPKSRLNVADWAAKYRVMPESGVKSGRWENETTPYLIEPMNALSEDNPARVVVLLKGTQIGGSEIGYNFIGYMISECPANTILALPTEKLYRVVSKQRIDPMIRICPEVRTRVNPQKHKSDQSTIDSKTFNGGSLNLITTKSASSLRLMNCRYVIADEIDAYPISIEAEGDPVALLRKRMSTFQWQSKFLITSTPLLKESSRVTAYYNNTDQREYNLPCPFCGKFHVLRWENMMWERGDPSSARMRCPECKKEYTEDFKGDMLPAGKWVASNDIEVYKDWVGFKLPALYSPYGWFSWRDAVEEYEKSEEDAHKRQSWTNTVLAEAFEHYSYKPDASKVSKYVINYGAKPEVNAPEEVLAITVGIDTQDKYTDIYVWGWGIGEKAFGLDYFSMTGDLTLKSYWDNVWALLVGLKYTTPSGRNLKIAGIGIDTAGSHTTEAYRFVECHDDKKLPFLYAMKGVAGFDKPIIHQSPNLTKSKAKKFGIDLWNIGSDVLKSIIYRKIERGDMRVPKKWANGEEFNKEFWRQMLSHEMREKTTGLINKKYWFQMRERDEALDCIGLAYATLKKLNVIWEVIDRKVKKKLTPPPAVQKAVDNVQLGGVDNETKQIIKRRRKKKLIVIGN